MWNRGCSPECEYQLGASMSCIYLYFYLNLSIYLLLFVIVIWRSIFTSYTHGLVHIMFWFLTNVWTCHSHLISHQTPQSSPHFRFTCQKMASQDGACAKGTSKHRRLGWSVEVEMLKHGRFKAKVNLKGAGKECCWSTFLFVLSHLLVILGNVWI